jgi:hypothetical protein
MKREISQGRRYVLPNLNDTLKEVALKHMPEKDQAETVQLLRTWNPHLVEGVFDQRYREKLLPSDIIFVEPPRG